MTAFSTAGSRALAFLLLLALAAWPFTTARADVLIKQDLPALHARSEKVVRARVASVQSAWNADRSFIFTYVTLEVLQHYKGSGPDRLEVRVPGGKVAGYRISAESMPAFAAGDEVMVFLTRWNDGALKVTGYEQGLSRIGASPQGPVLHGGSLDKRGLADAEREVRGGGPRRP